MFALQELKIFAAYVHDAREKTSAGTELTKIMLARSRAQLESSRQLLRRTEWLPRPWPNPPHDYSAPD